MAGCLNCQHCVLIGDALVCEANQYPKVYDREFEEYKGVSQAIVSRLDNYFYCKDMNFENSPYNMLNHQLLGLYEVSIECSGTLIKKITLHIYSLSAYQYFSSFTKRDWITYFCENTRVVQSLAGNRPLSDFMVNFKMIY